MGVDNALLIWDNMCMVWEIEVENMKIGDIVEYTFGYGKQKHGRLGSFQGYTDKGKVIFGRGDEFKDNIVDPKNVGEVFQTKEGVEADMKELGIDGTEVCECDEFMIGHDEECAVGKWESSTPRNFI
jgi:hypothetical protein